jgi:predicted amidohydrolase YtcJ
MSDVILRGALVVLLFLAGCASPPAAESGGVVYFGGRILTMADDGPVYAEAVVTRGDRIVYVGDARDAHAVAGRYTQRVDLRGRALLPGFIDPHVHFTEAAQMSLFHRVVPWELANLDAFVDHVAELARETPIGERIVVYGYDRALVPPYRHLTRTDLDRATTRHPVFVIHQNFHWASANTPGLADAGISADTPTRIPGGGIFFKDSDGEPNGVMTESALIAVIGSIQSELDEAVLRAGLFATAEAMSANGITTIADRATGASRGLADLETLRALAHDDAFPLRVTATPLHNLLSELDGPIPWDGAFQAVEVKLVLDASLVGGTSATLAPQLDGSSGNLNYAKEEYAEAVLAAWQRGFATATHTMGDRAHRVLVEVFESLEASHVGFDASRHAIEHSALVDPADVPRVAALGMSVSHLTPLLHAYGDAMSERVYGVAMARRLFPAASMLDAGINLALHSDAPILPAAPLYAVEVAAGRHTASGQTLGPDEGIPTWRALEAVTIGAARHLGLEDELGSIEVGKRADFVILDADPLRVDPKRAGAIRGIGVEATILGGRTRASGP